MSESKPCLSFFDDDQGEALYSGVVLLEGLKVRVRELTAEEYGRYIQTTKEIDDLMRALQAASLEDADAISEQIKARQLENFEYVCLCGIASWELRAADGQLRPFNEETLKKLRISHKATLCDKIVQRSSIGRDLTAFLAQS